VRIAHRCRRLAAHAWAAPATLAGLVLAAIVAAGGGQVGTVGGVLEVSGGRAWPWLARRGWRFQAITLGHVVLARDAAAQRACRVHEHVHVRQYERYGVLFFPAYLAASLAALARGGDPYGDNRFEREAFAAEVPRRPAQG
jgi:hypothetical protein